VVEEDEREMTGARSRLNLGHTIAHGLEALQGYGGIKHGDAVAVGMVVATHLAVILELESKGTLAELLDLLEHFGLPTKPCADFDSILPYVMRDKKFVGLKPMFILPREGCKCEMMEVDTDLLKKAYERAGGR
jgi:3-dehydroquinate synthetase